MPRVDVKCLNEVINEIESKWPVGLQVKGVVAENRGVLDTTCPLPDGCGRRAQVVVIIRDGEVVKLKIRTNGQCALDAD